MRSRTVVRLFFFGLFVVICFAQCYTILKNFLDYPTIINMYDVSPSLISILPGMTICNNNRLSLKKLAERNRTVRMALRDRFPGWLENQFSFTSKKEFNDFRDELAKLFENLNLQPQKELDNATMNRHFQMKPDTKPFIQYLDCGRTWTDSIECGNLTQIDSVRSRICTTILHRGAMLYDVVNRPELFNASRPASGLYSYFDAKEVIKMVINFEPEDYADLKRQIGARILFHDNAFVAASGDLDFFITRGYRYDFSIDRRDIKLLDEPYDDCWDYDKNNLDKYKTRIDPRVPLTGHTCFQNCVVRNVIHKSNCWPETMPYYRNDSLDPNQDIRICNWFRGSHHVSIFNELLRLDEVRRKQHLNDTALDEEYGNMTTTTTTTTTAPASSSSNTATTASTTTTTKKPAPNKSMRIYKKIRRFCWSQCILPCRISEYTVTMTRSVWPTDVKLMFDKTGNERAMRHCCALVAIKFTHFHYNVHEFKPKYDLANTVGDLGGLLAVWLGLSIVSVYNAFQKLIEFCTRRSIMLVYQQRRQQRRVGSSSTSTSSSSCSPSTTTTTAATTTTFQ